jgi:hypothetical protein
LPEPYIITCILPFFLSSHIVSSVRETDNTYQSSKACETAEMACEDVLEREAEQKLPSLGRFEAKYQECWSRFNTSCVGPARVHNQGEGRIYGRKEESAVSFTALPQHLPASSRCAPTTHVATSFLYFLLRPFAERLKKAWDREYGRFTRDYNERLLNGMVVLSLVAIVAFRFVIRISLAETLSWGAFLFLQIYPKTFVGEPSMFDRPWWGWLAGAWEILIFNPVTGSIDLNTWGLPLGAVAAVVYLTRRRWRGAVHARVAGYLLRRGGMKWKAAKSPKAVPYRTERDLSV